MLYKCPHCLLFSVEKLTRHHLDKCRLDAKNFENRFTANTRFRNKVLDRRFATVHTDEGEVL